MLKLFCPDCRIQIVNDICPVCQRLFAAENGIINALPADFACDQFKNTERKFWDFTYSPLTFPQGKVRGLEFHKHFLSRMAALGPGACVLEIAAGARGDGLRLLEHGLHVVETDISPVALQKILIRFSTSSNNKNYSSSEAIAKSRSVLSQAHFIACDAEHLPFLDGAFDGTFVAASFHHLPNPARGLSEMARVVKSGGLVIVALEPNHWPYKFIYRPLAPLKKWIRARRPRPADSIADDTTQGFRKKDLIKLFHDANLEIIEIRPVKFLLEFLDSGARLVSLLLRRPLQPPLILQKILSWVDKKIGYIPILNRLFWHWTIIGRKT